MLKRTVKLLRKTLIAILGFALIILGIILIPLPGPGFLVIVAGLFVLSLEFEWAEKYLNKAKQKLRQIRDKVDRNKNT